MKRICIIVEGETEEEFVKSILSPYFYSKNNTILQYSNQRGDLGFYKYKSKVKGFLYEKDTIVTSLIDFYRLRDSFPAYNDSKKIIDKY